MPLATDVGNTDFVGAKDPDAALAVEFYVNPVQNNFESSKKGMPVFEDVIYVRINVPGDKNSQVDTPAREDHRRRFPKQWQHFENKTKGDAREIGMPLTEWPVLTRSQAEEFRGMKFFTVESIANASDQNISKLGMMGGMSPHILREKARAFLAAAAGTAEPQRQAEELAKAKDEIKLLKEQMQRIIDGQAAAAAAAPVAVPVVAAPAPVVQKRGPGRPRKDAQGASA